MAPPVGSEEGKEADVGADVEHVRPVLRARARGQEDHELVGCAPEACAGWEAGWAWKGES